MIAVVRISSDSSARSISWSPLSDEPAFASRAGRLIAAECRDHSGVLLGTMRLHDHPGYVGLQIANLRFQEGEWNDALAHGHCLSPLGAGTCCSAACPIPSRSRAGCQRDGVAQTAGGGTTGIVSQAGRARCPVPPRFSRPAAYKVARFGPGARETPRLGLRPGSGCGPCRRRWRECGIRVR